MRVTDSFRYRTVSRNLNSSRERMTDLQEQLSTGKRINRPSDDPVNISKSMKLRTVLESNFQFQDNISDAVTQLTVQEESLNQIHDILLEMKELVTAGASDSIVVKKSIAEQVEQMMQNMLEVANTKFNGRYIFGGTETQNQPFVFNTNVINFGVDGDVVDYYGDLGRVKRQVNETTQVDVNLNGMQVFNQAGGEGIDLFQMMYDTKEALLDDDTDGVRDKMEDVETALEQTLNNFLKIGTRRQLVQFNEDRYLTQNTQIRATMSSLEDTDYGQAFVAFKAEENALNSALSAGARVVSPSLLDFIGV
ncbi:flagellar hook-associated protein FlgL [candidate division KSB1 bacterium]